MFEQLTREMQAENALGLALAAQLGNTPSELSLIVRTTQFDPATGGLQPIGHYVIQMVSLVEHKMALGLFNHVAYLEDHPLLYHHNAPNIRIFVTGPAADPDAVLEQLEDAHYQMFGQWRVFGEGFNKRAEPGSVLTSGMGLLGEMPKPFAEAASQVLTANNIPHNLVEDEPKIGHFKLMAFDNSYFVARSFTVEAVSADS